MSALDNILSDQRITLSGTRKVLIKNLIFELMIETWTDVGIGAGVGEFSEKLREKVSSL